MVFSAVFALVVGIGMIAQWVLSYLSKQIVELETEPIRIAFHIVAEMITAAALLAAGIGMLVGWEFARKLFLMAVGMLFYTAIVSPGYFAQKGNWNWLIFFGAIILLGVVSVILVI